MFMPFLAFLLMAAPAWGGQEPPLLIRAERLAHLRQETGDIYDAEGSVKVTQGPLQLTAGRLTVLTAKAELVATGGASFTLCDCKTSPAWSIAADYLHLKMDQRFVARRALFYIRGVPVAYLPYFTYPVSRQSGLLIPRLGYSSRWGVSYKQPIYWAIAPDKDATLTLESKGSRGEGVGVEYRSRPNGTEETHLQVEYFRDREFQVDRWALESRYRKHLTDQADVRLRLSYVNYNDHHRALSDLSGRRADSQAESDLLVTYRTQKSLAYLLTRYTLNLSTPSNNTTVQRLPEIGYQLTQTRLSRFPVYAGLTSSAVHFFRQAGERLVRFDLYPKLSMPMALSQQVTLTPWAGARMVSYDRSTRSRESFLRTAVPVGVHLEGRFLSPFETVRLTTTSALTYENIATNGRQDAPQFDDLDKIHNRQSVTATFSQRLHSSDASPDVLYWHLAETISHATPSASDLYGIFRFRPLPMLSIGNNFFYRWADHSFSAWNTNLTLDPSPLFSVVLGRRSTRHATLPQRGDVFNTSYLGDLESVAPIRAWSGQITASLPGGIGFTSSTYFDGNQKQFAEMQYTLRIDRQCWAAELSYLDLPTRNDLLFTIQMKGL